MGELDKVHSLSVIFLVRICVLAFTFVLDSFALSCEVATPIQNPRFIGSLASIVTGLSNNMSSY